MFPLAAIWRTRKIQIVSFAVLAFAPPLIALVVSFAFQPVTLARTFAGCVPAWCILIAWWITLKRQWTWPRAGLIGVAVSVVLATTLSVYTYERSHPMRQMLEWLESHAGHDELVCHSSESTHVFFEFYYPGLAIQVTDGNSDRCAWLLDESSIMTTDEVAKKTDEVIEQRGTLMLTVLENPVIKTRLYRLGNQSGGKMYTDTSLSPVRGVGGSSPLAPTNSIP
jgi:hypothetical protein